MLDFGQYGVLDCRLLQPRTSAFELGTRHPRPAGPEAPELTHGHRLPVGCRVALKPVLAGLHHEYRLESVS